MSLHPLLPLLASHPQWVVEHLQAYAELLGERCGQTASAWQRRALLLALAFAMSCTAAVLGGVALMLWALIPLTTPAAGWMLVLVPVFPLAIAALCWQRAARQDVDHFADVRNQLASDLELLREAGLA
jgi:uncharacterized membrane protein YqjE